MIAPAPGPWIPELFRSMLARDEDGKLWRIDQETWTWVPADNRADQLGDKHGE